MSEELKIYCHEALDYRVFTVSSELLAVWRFSPRTILLLVSREKLGSIVKALCNPDSYKSPSVRVTTTDRWEWEMCKYHMFLGDLHKFSFNIYGREYLIKFLMKEGEKNGL